ncbi:hypothetical protein EJ03DRAFT_192799 [Teratosphaeria nubilosa]|uniref:Uncharacterized protein n=1 Tax=Teratosphaeria nubilosa TaxID=161662 RepID=A0A6G1KZQ0_9PEZI|nr:hypothetical protein EJ03DRAFT_192799 [Teratosphaeria nubilosa]
MPSRATCTRRGRRSCTASGAMASTTEALHGSCGSSCLGRRRRTTASRPRPRCRLRRGGRRGSASACLSYTHSDMPCWRPQTAHITRQRSPLTAPCQRLFFPTRIDTSPAMSHQHSPPQESPHHNSALPGSTAKDMSTPEECFRYLDSVCDKVLAQHKHVRELCDHMRRYIKRSKEAAEHFCPEASVDDECLRMATKLQAENRETLSKLVWAGIEGVMWYRELSLGQPWTSQEETLLTIIAAQTTFLMRITGIQPTDLLEFNMAKAELFESQERRRACAHEDGHAAPSASRHASQERTSHANGEEAVLPHPGASSSADAHVQPTGRLKGKARKAQAKTRR